MISHECLLPSVQGDALLPKLLSGELRLPAALVASVQAGMPAQ
jgi:hypothetical protein